MKALKDLLSRRPRNPAPAVATPAEAVSIPKRMIASILAVTVFGGGAITASWYAGEANRFNEEFRRNVTALSDAHGRLQRATSDLANARQLEEDSLEEAREAVINGIRWLATLAGSLPGSMPMVYDPLTLKVDPVVHRTELDLAPLLTESWSLVELSSAILRNQQNAAWFSSSVTDIAEDQVKLLRAMQQANAPTAAQQPVNQLTALAMQVARTRNITDAQRESAGRMLAEIEAVNAPVDVPRTAFIGSVMRLLSTYDTALTATIEAERLSRRSDRHAVSLDKLATEVPANSYASLLDTAWQALALLAAISLLLGSASIIRATNRQKRAAEDERSKAEKRNDDTNEAIMQLLGEISGIASGDLTKRARVSENDVTGVIADAFNASTKKLASIVSQVKSSAESVNTTTHEATETIAKVAESATRQQEEVNQAADQVLKVVDTIQTVTSMTKEAARVSKNSMTSATKGREAVTIVIDTINRIRENANETARRVQRMSEQSDEITRIIDIITDITERTGVLALNANVQAAAAGDAGRGFAAVAAEVQQLAIRSNRSLKKINALVDAMQSDSREALQSMNSTVSEVEGGVSLATRAGDDLAIIEMTTGELADIVGEANASMVEQSRSAHEIGERITRVMDLSAETGSQLGQSSKNMQGILVLADQLSHSVAGLKIQ